MCLIQSNDNNRPINNEFNLLIIDNGFEYHLKWIIISKFHFQEPKIEVLYHINPP